MEIGKKKRKVEMVMILEEEGDGGGCCVVGDGGGKLGRRLGEFSPATRCWRWWPELGFFLAGVEVAVGGMGWSPVTKEEKRKK